MKPEIRFNGFIDEWVEKKLGEIANLYQPKTISSKELINKGVPVFGANGYIGYYSKANHLLDQVTISARGANTGHPSYVKGPVWITGNSMVVNIDDIPINKYFLYTLFLKYGFKKYVTGGAQPQLIRDVLLHVPIQLPTLPEQQKIGALFSKYDTVIALREQKLAELNALKKGLLQQMFDDGQATSHKPQVRFSGFNDEWVEKKLGELGLIQTGNTPLTSEFENYSETGLLWITPTDITSSYVTTSHKRLSEIGETKSRIADAGSILVTSIASIGKNTILLDRAAFNQQINALTPTLENDSYFLLTQSKQWSDKMKQIASNGTMPIVNKSAFSNIRTFVPTLPEQQKIGQLFKHLDARISNEQSKIEQLKTQKQGLLQRML